jgi:prepilin-type N-terminal cleavage/methylation domain-containing protein
MIRQNNSAKSENGFTIIELMVTIFVAALFLGGIVTLTTTYNYFMALARQTSIADNLSYRYLQKYSRSDYAAVDWFVCDNESDAVINPSTQGKLLESGTLSGNDTKLPDPVKYEVRTVAPYGCSGNNADEPVLVRSKITYGSTNREIVQTQYTRGTIQ